MAVIWTVAIFEDSFHVRRDVWPASIKAGEAEKLVTVGGCLMRTFTLAVAGNGGEAAVQDPDRVAVMVYVESAVGLTTSEPIPFGLLENV